MIVGKHNYWGNSVKPCIQAIKQDLCSPNEAAKKAESYSIYILHMRGTKCMAIHFMRKKKNCAFG